MAKMTKEQYAEFEYGMLVHQIKRNKERLIRRFSSQLTVVPNEDMGSPCVLWTGYTKRNGYGAITFVIPGGGYKAGETNKYVKQLLVHRLFLILKLQRPIAVDMDCAHRCHVRNCVSHVFEQSHKENCYERDRRRFG